MNADHYAIVVGIGRYPAWQPQLHGPENDAAAVYAWLTDPAGGAVPVANARLITSAALPVAETPLGAKPDPGQIVQAFDWLESLAQANNANGEGLQVGKRLYLFVAGHGFATRRAEGALFTANATRMQTHHVFASNWLEWFYYADYFDECVLWMDTCMTYDLAITPQPCSYRAVNGGGHKGSLFAAYAARYPKKAVEARMPDGKFHGAFTMTLLEGLRGAAATPGSGTITGQSLRDYLINGMKRFMTAEQLADSSVSREPDFGFVDSIVFANLPASPQFPLAIRRSTAELPVPFQVLGGSPLKVVAGGTLADEITTLQLETGLYVLRTDGAERSFEVLGENDHVDL